MKKKKNIYDQCKGMHLLPFNLHGCYDPTKTGEEFQNELIMDIKHQFTFDDKLEKRNIKDQKNE